MGPEASGGDHYRARGWLEALSGERPALGYWLEEAEGKIRRVFEHLSCPEGMAERTVAQIWLSSGRVIGTLSAVGCV